LIEEDSLRIFADTTMIYNSIGFDVTTGRTFFVDFLRPIFFYGFWLGEQSICWSSSHSISSSLI
jgi:hypothetical protein